MTSPLPDGIDQMDDRIQMEKNAGLIMATNNSSIVSKRSVERLYLPEPHFYRYFVKKPVRRSPTINRGYWLRMRAVEWVVRQFLDKAAGDRKVIINLGCGYDPLPFQWLSHDKTLCGNTKFIDVDYDMLMETKRQVILNTSKMMELLHERPKDPWRDPSILLDTEEYAAIGCDLRNLPRLGRLLRSVVDIHSCQILCIAEVSMTYMPTDAADALIEWTSGLSQDVTFCLLEQGSPDRPDHPFTTTMCKHFEKLGTPLQSIFAYPGEHTQKQRFRQAGFTDVEFQNLWELWADPRFISPSVRMSLDQVEPFDEWEDFALFASHYCLIVAHNRSMPAPTDRPRSRRDSEASLESDISARTASPFRPGTNWFGYRYCRDVGDMCQRHHASSYPVPDQDAIAVYGGIGPKARLSTTAVCRPRHLDGEPPVVLPPEAGSRCCHTVSAMMNGDNLLVGGRESPTQPRKDCWLQVGNIWKRIHDLPEPRYRHRTVAVSLPENVYGAVVYGGKTGPSQVAIDTLLWEPKKGWRVLRSLKNDPIPRFGPNFIRLGFNHGLLFGGMRQDGVIVQGLWRWRLIIRDNEVIGIAFRPSTNLDVTVGVYPWFARFGASYGILRDELLIIGGIARKGCIPKVYEILSVLGSFSAFMDNEKEMELRLTCVEPTAPPGCPRPFFVGHSTHRTRTGMSVILGGGATCFSFGNYFNQGLWVLHEKEAGLSTDWTVVPSRPSIEPANRCEKEQQTRKENELPISRKQITCSAEFSSIVRESQPTILQHLDLGSCVQRWTPAYLRHKLSTDRSVVIHSSPTRTMNFQRKDFAYQTVSIPQFLESLSDMSRHLYLRSLASSNPSSTPANFETDWPELASDFRIPPELDFIKANIHSSPLRISNDINMWLHYDVMANVYFQISGVKKLALFPPRDLQHLSFPPGSTTSELDIFTNTVPGQEDTVMAPAGTKPYIAVLYPGDALYIPPLWSHTGISLKDKSFDKISSNISNSQQTVTQMDDPGSSPSSRAKSSSTAITTFQNEDLNNAEVASTLDHRSHSQSTGSNETANPYTNIAVNVFFRNLPQSKYASGRDVYGNRDLAAYEEGRRDVDKIVKRFTDATKGKQKSKTQMASSATDTSAVEESNMEKIVVDGQEKGTVEGMLDSIPADMTEAYLLRLAQELKDRAQDIRLRSEDKAKKNDEDLES